MPTLRPPGTASLWLSGVHNPLSKRLGGSLPASHTWEIILSLTLVAVGIGIGIGAARRRDLGTTGAAAFGANWLGLPSFIDMSVTRPVLVLASMAATIDARVIDAGVQSAARLACSLSHLAAAGDDRVVDGGVRFVAGLGRLLSRLGANMGEVFADGLPTLTAQIVATGGRQTVRLQSGMTHHYYALIAGGTVIVVALLLLGT